MDAVREQIIAGLPGIQFYREPSGAEMIAAARAAGVEMPEVIRKHMEQQSAEERAEYRGDDFSVELYGFEAQPLRAVLAEVRATATRCHC
jgi:hypothetical protein